MDAKEYKIRDFMISNKTIFIIPVYQRNYDWTLIQCKQLLTDIIEAGHNDNIKAHFIGSIVYVWDKDSCEDIKEYLIIDGQQRLTTITLIYLAIYHFAKKIKNEYIEFDIRENYLFIKTNINDAGTVKLKLRPTDNNDIALKYLLRNNEKEIFPSYSKLIENYNYFQDFINENNYLILLKGLAKLIYVDISLKQNEDNPQRIFESLNSTGLELSQADLIRNYILMDLKNVSQNKIYHEYWEVIENNAKDILSNTSHVSEFIRDYLTLINKKIPVKDKVYFDYKKKFPKTTISELENHLSDMKSLVFYYNKLLNPYNEQDKDIQEHLIHIKSLEMNVTYPFLMKVYEDFGTNLINKPTFISILEFIQSYIWRRFIVGLPTNALNKIFMNLYDKVDHDSYLLSIQKSILLRTGVQRFPGNTEVINSLKEKDVYNINPKNRIYLFEKLENYDNNEKVLIKGNELITIEHIFPQKPDKKWKFDLNADEYKQLSDKYLNTIGNLTLSGNNGKLGNKSFIEKRDLPNLGYSASRLWLNKYLSSIDCWNTSKVNDRFNILKDRFLEIWRMPDIEEVAILLNNEVNIFDAEEPKNKKLEYAIFLDQKLNIKNVTNLYSIVFKQLFELSPETFFTPDISQRLVVTKNPTEDLRQPIQISDLYYIEGNIDSNSKFEKIKFALEVFNFTEELYIKYEEKSIEEDN